MHVCLLVCASLAYRFTHTVILLLPPQAAIDVAFVDRADIKVSNHSDKQKTALTADVLTD